MKYDVVIIGGGLAGVTAAQTLLAEGLSCAIVAEGLSLRDVFAHTIVESGGAFFGGDRVVSSTFDGNRVTAVHTRRLEDEPLEARFFILGTGKYFSKGIVVDMESIYEPVFGLDIEADADRTTWFDRDFSAPQRFLSFGVRDCGDGRVSKGGVVLENVFAAGEVLSGISGADPDAEKKIRESALRAAADIG